MCNVNESDAEFSLHLLKLDLHLLTHLEVQCSQRLVQKKDPRAVNDGSCDGNSLHLSAGELVDISLAIVIKSYCFQRLVNSLLDLLFIYLLDLESECHVIKNIEVREQSISLEYGVDVALIGRNAL